MCIFSFEAMYGYILLIQNLTQSFVIIDYW